MPAAMTERAPRRGGPKAIETYAQNIVDTVREPLLILDATAGNGFGDARSWGERARRRFEPLQGSVATSWGDAV